jgi:N-acyl-D-amino-acid deacylase
MIHAAVSRAERRPAGVAGGWTILWILIAWFGCSVGTSGHNVWGAPPEFDLIIRGGRVHDGSGAPWFVADVGIADGKIAAIGRLKENEAADEMDAEGLVVAPGFVDMMGQTATPLLRDPDSVRNLLTQGVTTINCGEGDSAAPRAADQAERLGWSTMSEYFALLESKGLPVNVVQTVGHTRIRQLVLGDVDRRPFDEELERMRQHVREAMEAGAIGLSTALIYPPAVYADAKEIAALAEVAGAYGGRYYTHMRNEGDQLLEAIEEALQIGELAGCPVHIFHLKAAGRDNWGKLPLAIARIGAARVAGQQVTADVYPYVNNGLGASALIHPRHFAKGRAAGMARLEKAEVRAEIRREMEETDGWENWFRHAGRDWQRIVVGRGNVPRYAEHDGLSVAALAERVGEDPWDTFFELVEAGAFLLPETMSEANKALAMRQPFVSFCTDVGPAGGGRIASHPRAYGAFPRLLRRYVLDWGVLSMEQAISQASAAAANNIMAHDRGRLAVGLAADVIVFDPETIGDRASFAEPDAVSKGMKHVVVNGEPVLRDGGLTGARPGRVLRGPGYRRERAPHRVGAEATLEPAAREVDGIVRETMRRLRVPGMSVALAAGGRVHFARGYGYADLASGEPVTPQSLFRIASISKPITAVAVLQLVEQGRIGLDDSICELLALDDEIAAAGESFDRRWGEITVRYLLQHRGGWDRDASFDAMFRSVDFARQQEVPPPAGPTEVIRAMLRQPLDFEPGTRYAYSNFGYCLLGRVIERCHDGTYADYVQAHVLNPLGIERMRLGRTRFAERAPGEVRYYHPDVGRSVFAGDLGESVASPYGAWYLEAMDSHGGWLATAGDLARFAMALDDPADSPLLSAASIEKMHARPGTPSGSTAGGEAAQARGKTGVGEGDGESEEPPSHYYSLGWSNRVVAPGRINHWHTGSLPGTAAILIRRHDGKTLVALVNCRAAAPGRNVKSAIDRMLHRAADRFAWPEVDQK